MASDPPNQPPYSPAPAYVLPIPYGIGVEVLQAVLTTWPAGDDRPVLVATHLAGPHPAGRVEPSAGQPGAAPPPEWGGWVPGDGPRALVRCRQPADLFRLGRYFERFLRRQVFDPPANR